VTVVVLGPHGVGKSTLGRALAARLGWAFHEELGAVLARARPAEQHAGCTQAAFDTAVTAAELARDAAWGDAPRVVETWHPGNLAYAARRSPRTLGPLVRAVRRRRFAPCVAVALDAPDRVLAARKHEAGPLSFFAAVGRAAPDWAERLGVPVVARVHTHPLPVDALVDGLLPLLRSVR